MRAYVKIVGVVIADPLYKWAMTPVKAQQRQHDYDADNIAAAVGDGAEALGNVNTEHALMRGSRKSGGIGAGSSSELLGNANAEHAVMRVKQKLSGTDSGEGAPRSVPGQVAALLAEAQDPNRLSRMYHGWAAWM